MSGDNKSFAEGGVARRVADVLLTADQQNEIRVRIASLRSSAASERSDETLHRRNAEYFESQLEEEAELARRFGVSLV